MIADFVSKRGGGLLMLGGRRSFAEGGWAGTPVGEVLPVTLDASRPAERTSRSWRSGRRGPARPARSRRSPPTRRRPRNAGSSFPPVTTVNPVHGVKPGATMLLSALDNRKQDQVVLASQRYGRGKALAMPIQDSWQWRMNAKMPVTDTTYATFWRRLGRWLVDDVPDKVMLTMTQDRVDPGQPMKLTAEVLDAQYNGVNDARVVATSDLADGQDHRGAARMDRRARRRIPLERRARRGRALHDPRGGVARRRRISASDTAFVRASAADSEYFDATMRAPLLKRIAEETGGRFYTHADAATLPEAISYSGRGVTVVEERDLWDMPAILLLLIALTGGEWAYRRARGLI